MCARATPLVPKGGLDWRKDQGAVGRLKSDRSWSEIERRLSAGESPGSIARWALKEGKVSGVKWKTLASKLRDHRDRVLRGITRPGTQVAPAHQEVDGSTPLLKDLDWLIRHQRARIREGRALEAQTKIPVAQVTRDVEALGKLMEIRANLSMDLGLHKRQPLRIQSTHLGVHAHLVALGTDGRERLRRAAGEFLRQVRGQANGAEAGPGDSPAEAKEGP